MAKSTWLHDTTLPAAHPALTKDVSAEVVIVGGGLMGTFSAYLSSKGGKSVVLLEKKDMANSVTAYTTAWLNCVIDTDLQDLVKMYSLEGAGKIWRSGMEAIALLEKIIEDEKIDCDFSRVSQFHYAETERGRGRLNEEHMFAKQLGFETVLHDADFLPFKNIGSLEIKSQAKFHPIKFLIGLRKAAEKYGSVIFENTEALDIHGTATTIVMTKGGNVRGDFCILATYEPFQNPKELFGHKGIYTSFVLELKIPHGLIREGLYEDERNPYHYFRVDRLPGFDRVVLGGEDHRKEIPMPEEKSFRALEEYFKNLFPNIKYTIERKWSGPIIETLDGLPYIGQYSEAFPNRFVATGFSGNGMTYSAVAAQICADAILKKQNPYATLYNASRKTRPFNFLKKMEDFIGEFFGGVVKNVFK